MERRHFMKVGLGFAVAAAGAAVLAASAEAAPLLPQPLADDVRRPRPSEAVRPAVTTADEASQLKPEDVYWHGRHWGWHRRHWGWRHRHWGWRHRWHRW